MRAPYQVLVFPYCVSDKGIEYAIFHRSDADWWQAISGGGEEGEMVIESRMKTDSIKICRNCTRVRVCGSALSPGTRISHSLIPR